MVVSTFHLPWHDFSLFAASLNGCGCIDFLLVGYVALFSLCAAVLGGVTGAAGVPYTSHAFVAVSPFAIHWDVLLTHTIFFMSLLSRF